MTPRHRVNLLGFSDFERGALSSYFRLAGTRLPAYEQVATPADADFLVVDADQPEAVRVAIAFDRVAASVFIGARAPEGAVAWMTRPIDPLHVLRELDAMVELQGAPPPLAPVAAVALTAAPETAARKREVRALIVDDSEIALRFLETRLAPLSIASERATNSARAIELLSLRSFDFVFLDVELGPASEMDGLALCQHIKRQHRPPRGMAVPVVVMVSAHRSELDRVRGMLAGADAYLGKPVDEEALAHLLARHGAGPARAKSKR